VSCGQVLLLDLVAAPAEECVVDEGVLHVDEDADAGVDAGELLDDERGGEEGCAGAAVLLGHLDAHQAELEELGDQRRVHPLRLVHLVDERADGALGEVAHGVAEHRLFLAEHRERRAARGEINGCHRMPFLAGVARDLGRPGAGNMGRAAVAVERGGCG